MKETITLNGQVLNEVQYVEAIKALEAKGYAPIIDPRAFDSPLTIKARFTHDAHTNVRYIEFSPMLELSVEHELSKKKTKEYLNKLLKDFETLSVGGDLSSKDYEAATLRMITSQNPVITPKTDADRKLFESLEEKKIFSLARELRCPGCDQAFIIPARRMSLGTHKSFCVDCQSWFGHKTMKEVYVINEEYMKVLDSVWDKTQKLIKSSWREVLKRGVPIVKQ